MNTSVHLSMLLAVSAFVAATVLAGNSLAAKRRSARLDRILGGLTAGVVMAYNVYYFLPSVFRWDVSLPLHICDLLGFACVLALWTRRRIARSFVYFLALPLAAQAIITPVGDQYPETPRFWLYWLLHAAILACSIYDLVVRGYRPRTTDFARILLVDLLYVALLFPLNVVFGWNYGYIGNAVPDTITAITFLGPWPWRVLVILALVVALQAGMMVPWLINRNRRPADAGQQGE